MFQRYEAPDSDESGSDGTSSGHSSDESSSSFSPTLDKKGSDMVSKMKNLSLNQLLCMEVGEDGDESRAAANGKSKDRIAEAFKRPCCKNRCKKHLGHKLVFAFCMAFWSLSKNGQDCLLPG